MKSQTVSMSGRKDRVQVACRMYGAPAALADEMNAQGLTVRRAYELLQNATGKDRTISAAGVDQVRVAMTITQTAQQIAAATAEAERLRQVGELVCHYGLAGTKAGGVITASGEAVEVLHGLIRAAVGPCGRLDAAAQAGLLRDLSLVTQTNKETP